MKVFCLKERVLLYSADDINVRLMCYRESNRTLYVSTIEDNILEYQIELSKDLLKELFSNNLKFFVKKHYLESAEEVCLKYIR